MYQWMWLEGIDGSQKQVFAKEYDGGWVGWLKTTETHAVMIQGIEIIWLKGLWREISGKQIKPVVKVVDVSWRNV